MNGTCRSVIIYKLIVIVLLLVIYKTIKIHGTCIKIEEISGVYLCNSTIRSALI